MNKLRIGIVGSCADIKDSQLLIDTARLIGRYVAESGSVLIFGTEPELNSLPALAAEEAEKFGGITIGIVPNDCSKRELSAGTVSIFSGSVRGGGRELTLVRSCDVLISIQGGSGTLNEIAIAYQADIPVIALSDSGGWSTKLADKFLDTRKRLIIFGIKTPKLAVKKAIELGSTKRTNLDEILWITATHGNENVGVEAMRDLEKKSLAPNWLIANSRAYKKRIRKVQADLNRVAPGLRSSPIYEVRRAYEILNTAKKFKYVIDIHSTPADTGIFAIVTNPTLKNLVLAGALPIKNIVIWSNENETTGPLTRFVSNGIEIECGPKNKSATKNELSKIVDFVVANGICPDANNLSGKNIFRVRGKLMKNEFRNDVLLKEFQLTKYQNELFYPLFINRYDGVACYKLEKVEDLKLN